MNQETLEIIKKLSQQVNVGAIETKDLVKELESLYKTVGAMEVEITSLKESSSRLLAETSAANKALESWRIEYVTPRQEVLKEAAALERAKWEFELEKKWITKDRENMLQIVKMLTARHTSQMSDTQPAGGYHSESHNWEKADLK